MGNCNIEINSRLSKAWNTMVRLTRIWKDGRICKFTKMRLAKTPPVFPIGTYACKTCTINAEVEKNIEGFKMFR